LWQQGERYFGREAMALLRVIAGPDLGKGVQVDAAPVTIGRGDECGLVLTDEHVSLIHAAVEPHEGGFRVRDLETSAGTRVNGERILERRLMFGDLIALGASTLLFGSGSETVGTETVGSAESPGPDGPGAAHDS
jgi:pSer/pThr/pTyr-binding forkhead associated (FHA) protein